MTSSSASSPLGSADSIAGLIAFVDPLEARVMSGGSGEDLLNGRGTFTFSETVQHAAQSIGYAMTGYPRLSHPGIRATLGRAVKHLFSTAEEPMEDVVVKITELVGTLTEEEATHSA